jgi:hypothetical protein
MLGAAAVQDAATLVRSGVRKLIDAVEEADGRAAEEFTSRLRFDYSRPRERPAGDWQDKAARQALLAEVARDAERALRAVEEDDELTADAAIAEAAKLLREIVGQEFELADDELPRPRSGRRSRQILSAEDPEMRHARSSAARPFTGYKIHAAADTEAPLLTSIALSPGNEHDGHHAGTLVDRQPEQRRPTRVIGDTAYGNIEVREELEWRSISVLAPVHSTSPKTGRSPRMRLRSISRRTPSPAPRATRGRSTSPDGIGEATPAFGSPSSWNPTASPARCVSAAHPPAGGGSGSPAARTSARPGFGR